MQRKKFSQSPASPLLQPQVPQCIVHNTENSPDTNKDTSATNQEIELEFIHGDIKEAVHSVPTATEDKEGNQHKKEEVDEKIANDQIKKIAGPDGGWSWLVLLGAFVVMTLVSTVGPCFSVVFSQLLLDLGSSSTTIAWIFNIFSLVWNLAGPVVGPLTAEVGHRPVAMVGSLMMATSIIISSFATSAWHLLLFFSLLGGLGAGMVVTTSVLIIPCYFTRRLGRANGILMAGTSVGQFIAPPLISFLQEKYAFRGATFILSAIILNTFTAAVTFHPVAWHTGRLVPVVGRPVSEVLSHQPAASLLEDNCKITNRSSLLLAEQDSHYQDSKSLSSDRSPSNRKSRKMNRLFLRVARSTVRDLGILRIPRALVIAVSSTLLVNGYLNFILMVPFMMQAAGHSQLASAWLVSVSGVCNLLTRLVVSALSEFSCFDMYICYVAGICVVAASCLAFTFLTKFTWLMVVMGMWGCGIGAYMGLYNLIMIRYLGVHRYPAMFGSANLLNGLGFIFLGPLLGKVRDLSESYAVSIWILASTQFLCVVLWLFMPAIVTRDERKVSQKSTQPINKECQNFVT